MKASDVEELHEVIGRELDPIEGGTYETFEALPVAVEAIALTLANAYRRNLACKYLLERVIGADLTDAMLKLEAIMERKPR